MKRLNTTLSFLMIALFAVAQPQLSSVFKVSTSTPYDVVDAQSKQYFSDNKGFAYSVKTNRENVIVQKFDIQNMKEVARNEYTDVHPYNKAISVMQIGDAFFYIYESLEKETEKRSVYLKAFKTEDCSLGKEKLLFTTDGAVANSPIGEDMGFIGPRAGSVAFGYLALQSGPPFMLYKSFDNSKIMIKYRRKPIKKDDDVNHDLMGFFVFDSTFDLIWGREVKMPYTEKEMNNLAYTVGSDGNVYMMSLYREKGDFRLLTIPPAGDLTITVVDNGDFMFQHLYMKENKSGNIDFLGYYANGLDYKFFEGSFGNLSFNTNGIRYFELTKNGKVLKSKDIEFPVELINKYESESTQNKNEKREEAGNAGIRDLVLRQFTVNPDGSIFVLGEQYYYTVRFDSRTYTQQYSFFYEDLLATKLSAEGEVLWMEKIPKRQFGNYGKGGLSIAYLEGNQAHYVLFLDNVKNADIDINEVPARHMDGKGGYLTAYKIDDGTGKIEKHTIYNSLQVNGVTAYQFQTNRIFKAMDDVLLVEVYIKNKKDMMIKMELTK